MTKSSTPHNDLGLDPSVLTIFGITGDLANRYILPALYHLAHNNMLPSPFRIVGVSRKSLTKKHIIDNLRNSLNKNHAQPTEKTLNQIEAMLSVVSMDITDKAEYARLKKELDAIEDGLGRCLHRLFYLSIPATIYEPVVERLGQHDLNNGCQHGSTDSRLLIEKPFGFDLVSAEKLVKTIAGSFQEKQVYRIDHYLAKETVQNILTLRASNPLLDAVWNNQHINRVVISADESIGIGSRAASYDPIGALRDIIQSHLMQILALVTMEIPQSITPVTVHQGRQHVLASVQVPAADTVTKKSVRGQYRSYRQEIRKNSSQTETFAEIELAINNKQWRGVPFLLRTGKKLKQKSTQVTLTFRHPATHRNTNHLTIQLQPNEGIGLGLRIKKPGFDKETEHVEMKFSYGEEVNAKHPDAYERVLVDTLRGDQTLFATSKEVLRSWQIVQPILDNWQKDETPLQIYRDSSSGPATTLSAGDELAA